MISSDELTLPQTRINQLENDVQTPTLTANNGIMRIDDTHFLIEVTSEELGILQEKRLNRSVQNMQDIIPRKEAEKEISRLDKDISEIKTGIKEMNSEIKEMKSQMSNFVTKDYLNSHLEKEFKKNKGGIISEVKVIISEEAKTTRRWLIGTAVAIGGLVVTIIKLFL